MALPLNATITPTGRNQGDIYAYLSNVMDIVNELIDDHATNKTLMDELKTRVTSLRSDMAAVAAKLDSDAGVTDTNYAAQLTTAVVAASSAATLTNSTPLKLTP